VGPITVSTTIAAPPERVFGYLADIANHAEFSDHYLVDWHLTNERSYGAGAGARFRVKAPLSRFSWADVSFAELESPSRIVERGHGGKYNRVQILGTYALSRRDDGGTEVRYTLQTVPAMLSDRLLEVLGGRAWSRRQTTKAMRRLRSILEDDRGRGDRVSVAGG